METPMKSKGFTVPATPALKQLGYGTGVGVYHLDRSPKPGGVPISPWAVKKVLKSHKHSTYGKVLKDEAKILKQLSHPNIIGFRAFKVLDDGRTALAMEKCSQSLGDMAEERFNAGLGPFPAENILKVAKDVASALRYLHDDVKLLHGDIKSFNVLVNGDFESVKLADFGMSLKLDAQGVAVGEYCGTRCWTAPEALPEDEPVTSAADVWAYGLTLWEMISVTPPHVNTDSFYDESGSLNLDDESILDQHEEGYGTRPPLPECQLGGEYKPVIELFEKCTEIDPKLRPSAQEILDFLA